MTKEQLSNPDALTPGTMILLYETARGRRYRVGQRDDGNYFAASLALSAAQEWLQHEIRDNVVAAR